MSDKDNRSVSSSSSRSSCSGSVDDEEGDRLQWGSQAEFILTLVGYAVGLGNVWRFPYLAYKNGGGAFLIPYFICLLLVGVPIFFLEVSFGQFASLGPLAVWSINPLFKGLGVAMVITNTLIAGYYAVIICWCMYFFFASMAAEVPWADCDNSWNSELCVTPEQAANLSDSNLTVIEIGNITYNRSDLRTPSEEYFYNNVLQISDGLDEFGTIVWQLACTLLLTWVTVFLVLLKGIGSLGKVVYFSSIFPYVIMTIMVIRGCTLEGADVGIDFYLNPDWSKLAEPTVWSDAATQIFYSLSACSGGLIAMASYNKFNNNALRDSIVVPLINCLTSFYSGFAIFSVLGFMAVRKGVTVDEVAASGPGLVFVVYPEGLQQMPVAPVWSVLFFFMMLMLGFSSVFSMAECLFSSVIDEFEVLQYRKSAIAFRCVGCICFFCFGLIMVSNAGFYIFNIIDSFTGGFPLLFVGLFEFICISYIYGYSRFANDIKLMLGKKPSWVFAGAWMVISPLLLLAVIIFLSVMYEPLALDGYVYPAWGQGIGWLVVCLCILPIPLFFMINYCKAGGAKVLRKASQPTDEWGPALKKNRKGTIYDKGTHPSDQLGIAYTETSAEPFHATNGNLTQYLPVGEGLYHRKIGDSHNEGYSNLVFDDSFISESTAF